MAKVKSDGHIWGLEFNRYMVENTLSCNMRYVWPQSKYLLLRVIFTQTI